MKADERRKKIADLLMTEERAISGGALAERFGVSRQIIVHDVSLLKASGYEILATHSGYIMQATPLFERVFKVHHTTAQTADELSLIVGLGGTVVDVFVWHKAYGRMEAKLNISTKDDVDRFIESVRSGKSIELMSITGGYHYHTVRAESERVLERIGEELAKRNYIAPHIGNE